MSIDDQSIIRMCGEARRFSSVAGWQFQGMAVMQWEFASISAFAEAKMQLLRAITPMMMHARSDAAWQRATSPDECEIDCNGVTFRLICKQRLATPLRTVCAAEILFHPFKEG